MIFEYYLSCYCLPVQAFPERYGLIVVLIKLRTSGRSFLKPRIVSQARFSGKRSGQIWGVFRAIILNFWYIFGISKSIYSFSAGFGLFFYPVFHFMEQPSPVI
jgi:hypothetical protein